MNPLLMIAASLLPEIAKTLVAEKDRAAASAVAAAVSKAVTDVAGTTDAAAAGQKIAADPAVAADLRLKLAQIAADREDRQRQAAFDTLKARLDAEAQDRAQQMEVLKAQLADGANARTSFQALAQSGSWGSLGAPLVSAVVTIGFFVLVLLLVVDPSLIDKKEGAVMQLLNVMFGTFATGFATVISFWLGSSQGSRNKDATSFALQTQQAEQTNDLLKSTTSQAAEVGRASATAQALPLAAMSQPAKPSNYKACLDLVLVQEGGFSDHPRDPGGATNLGITQKTLESWRGAPVSTDDVKNLSRQEAGDIYRAKYWNVVHGDALPAGVDLVTFDIAVNSGPGRAARMLQKAVGANQDGAIGPATLAATRAADPAEVIRSMTAQRLAFYQGLDTFADFGRGWTRRSNDIETAALAMARKPALAA